MTGLDLGINLDDFTRLRDALQRAGLPEQSIRECQAAARMDAAAYAQHPRSAQTPTGSSQPAPTTTNAAALWDASLSCVLLQAARPATDHPDTVTTAPALDLEPSAPPPKAKDYPDWLKARAVAMHRSGESRETIRAMLIEQFGRAPDITNWSKTVRRWEASNPTTPGS